MILTTALMVVTLLFPISEIGLAVIKRATPTAADERWDDRGRLSLEFAPRG